MPTRHALKSLNIGPILPSICLTLLFMAEHYDKSNLFKVQRIVVNCVPAKLRQVVVWSSYSYA